jgi:hypothetical protein
MLIKRILIGDLSDILYASGTGEKNGSKMGQYISYL